MARPKLTVYMPNWCFGPASSSNRTCPPNLVDWTGVDFVVHFSNYGAVTQSPYFDLAVNPAHASELKFGPAGGSINYRDMLLQSVHAKGGKVVLAIQAVDPSNLNAVANDINKTNQFCAAAASFAKTNGYDGLELDWEGWGTPLPPATIVNRFTAALRAAIDAQYPNNTGLLLSSAGRFDQNLYSETTGGNFDMHNIQMYSFGAIWNGSAGQNNSWFLDPISVQTGYPSGIEIQSMDHDFVSGKTFPKLWTDAGHPLSKISIGLGCYGMSFSGVSAPGWGKSFSNSTNDIGLDQIEKSAGAVTYYTPANQPGKLNGNTYYTYNNSQSIAAKVAWAIAQGLGGVMLYDIWGMMRPGKTGAAMLPELYAAVAALGGVQASPTGTFTASLTSLPAGGGSVTFTWTSQNATSANISGIGSVTPVSGGSVTVNVTSSGTYTLTLTGNGGTITLNVAITVASASPTGSLSVNPASLPSGGGNVVFTTTSQNASSAVLNPSGVTVPVNGSTTINVTNTGSYSVTFTGAGGTFTTQSVTVTVDSTSVDHITVATVGSQLDVPSTTHDITLPVTFAFGLIRTTTGAAVVTVTPQPFTVNVPVGVTNMTFTVNVPVRIQK